jgi:hypothetical protein
MVSILMHTTFNSAPYSPATRKMLRTHNHPRSQRMRRRHSSSSALPSLPPVRSSLPLEAPHGVAEAARAVPEEDEAGEAAVVGAGAAEAASPEADERMPERRARRVRATSGSVELSRMVDLMSACAGLGCRRLPRRGRRRRWTRRHSGWARGQRKYGCQCALRLLCVISHFPSRHRTRYL